MRITLSIALAITFLAWAFAISNMILLQGELAAMKRTHEACINEQHYPSFHGDASYE